MPTYHWTGRTSSGHAVSGSLESSSKEAVVAALRAQHITIETITERSQAPRAGAAFGRIALGLLLLVGAVPMAMIAKGTRLRCSRTDAAYDCTMETTMAGFRPMVAEDIRGVRAATDDGRTSFGYDARQRAQTTSERHRLVLSGATSTLASEWMAHPIASCASVASTVNDHLARRDVPSFETWQVELPPIAVALVLATIGLLVVLSGVRRLVSPA